MAIHNFLLAYEVSGKAPSARRASTFKIAELVSLPVEEVSPSELHPGVKIDLDGYSEIVKFYDNQFWIQDKAPGHLAAALRAQIGLIDNFRLAKALETRGTFEVLHYRDPEVFGGLYKDDIVETLKDANTKDRENAYDHLQEAVQRDLIDVDGELYVALGDPVICLRLLPEILQIMVAFNNTAEPPASDVYTIRLPLYDMLDGGRSELDALIDIWKRESGRDMVELSTAKMIIGISPKFDYSPFKAIPPVAVEFASKTAGLMDWPTERIQKWTNLRDSLKTFRERPDDDNMDKLAEAVSEYSDTQPVLIRTYAKMLTSQWILRDILLDPFN